MQVPEKYEANKSVAARDAAEFVPKIIAFMDWKNNENILDYGCGAGSTGYHLILPEVEKYDSILYAVDISEKMIDFAKNTYPHARISYATGDILQKFPFENVHFDKIFAIYVFHFIPDLRIALKGFYDIMNSGGRLGFTMVPKSYYWKSIRILGESEKWKNYMKGYKEFVPEWMNYEEGKGNGVFPSILEEAGFHIVHLEIQKRSFRFNDIETYLELYMSINPSISRIPQDLLPEFKIDLRKLVTEFAGIPLDSSSIISQYEFVFGVVEKP